MVLQLQLNVVSKKLTKKTIECLSPWYTFTRQCLQRAEIVAINTLSYHCFKLCWDLNPGPKLTAQKLPKFTQRRRVFKLDFIVILKTKGDGLWAICPHAEYCYEETRFRWALTVSDVLLGLEWLELCRELWLFSCGEKLVPGRKQKGNNVNTNSATN